MRNGRRKASPVSSPSHVCDGSVSKKRYFFAALFLAVLRAVRRGAAFFLPPRFAARFFGAARFFAALRFVVFLAARFFGAARFFAALRFVVFLAARFFGAARFFAAFFAVFLGAALRFLVAFFFGASEAVGVIIDIMSAIIVASPV